MRKLLGLLAIIVLLAGGFMAWKMLQPPPTDLDLARSKATASGMFVVSIAPETEPVQQGPLHSWIATVALPDGTPVEDANMTIDGGMPQHGHGLPTVPQMTGPLGNGKYRIEGVKFNMGGWWEFKLAIEAGGKTDTVTFNIVL